MSDLPVIIVVLSLVVLSLFGAAVFSGVKKIKVYKEKIKENRMLDKIVRIPLELNGELDLEKVITNSIDFFRTNLGVLRCSIVLEGEAVGAIGGKGIIIGDDLENFLSEIEYALKSSHAEPAVMEIRKDTIDSKREYWREKREVMVAPIIHDEEKLGFVAISEKIDGTDFTALDKKFVSLAVPKIASAIVNALRYEDLVGQHQKQSELMMTNEHGFMARKTLSSKKIVH